MLMVSPVSLVSPRSGEGVRIQAIARHMARDCSLTLISPTPPEDLDKTELTSSIADHRYVPLKILGAAATAARSVVLPYDTAHFRYRPANGPSLERFDVYYAHQPRGWELLSKTCVDAIGSVSVADLQNDDHDLWMQRAAFEKSTPIRIACRIYGRRAADKLRRLIKETSLVFCVSEVDMASMIKREGASTAPKFEVVPNGVDNASFSPPSENRRLPSSFVFVGSLDIRMNQVAAKSLLEIWPAVLRHNPNAVLTLAGRNPPTWLERAQSTTIRVVSSPRDVRPYLWEASAFLAPFDVGAGTKIKLLEAMSAEVPIIATRASMQGIPAGPDRHYIEIGGRDDIPAAAARILENPTLATELAGTAKQLAAAFDWSVIAHRAFERIEESLANREIAAGDSTTR
jgi:glycosyltransferase involved in cell wall biosynthesis